MVVFNDRFAPNLSESQKERERENERVRIEIISFSLAFGLLLPATERDHDRCVNRVRATDVSNKENHRE